MTQARNSRPTQIAKLKAIVVCAPFVFALGCSPYSASVSGTVTIDGEPLPVGNVMYYPVLSGTPANGSIDSNGRYRLSTGSELGLEPGDYIVTVQANEPPEVEFGPGGAPPPPGKRLAPLKYLSKKTSGLTFTVEKGRNTNDIELSSAE